MGTHAILLRCIKACITTPMFSISINGELTGFFASNRGVLPGVISSSGTDSFGAISAAENSKPVNDVRTDVAHQCNASDFAGNSKGVRCGSTLSGVAAHMGAFSATNFSEIINHHGSLIGIGSGDFPPLCPSVKVASGK